MQVSTSGSQTNSLFDAPTINVQDAFNKGGAGQQQRQRPPIESRSPTTSTSTSARSTRCASAFSSTAPSTRTSTNGTCAGTWTYRNIEDYRAGIPQQFSQRIGTLDTSFSQYQGGIYWSDEFRVHRDVTLGIGVRNELQSRIDDKLNLMPRLGFTWAPFGSQRSAVRGGYGLFYDWYDSGLYDQTLRVDGVDCSRHPHLLRRGERLLRRRGSVVRPAGAGLLADTERPNPGEP